MKPGGSGIERFSCRWSLKANAGRFSKMARLHMAIEPEKTAAVGVSDQGFKARLLTELQTGCRERQSGRHGRLRCHGGATKLFFESKIR